MNARKYPRTLQQAFGPYTSSALQPMHEEPPYRASDAVIAVLLVLVVIALVIGLI